MGGKSYFCDYCRCYMKNDYNVRKVHNSGMSHKIAKTNYLWRYADPHELLTDQISKAPCARYRQQGYCKFELFCQYSHYTFKNLEQLRNLVNKLEQKKNRRMQPAGADWRHLLPWNVAHNERAKRKRRIKLPRNLPKSLKPIKFNKLTEDCLNSEWG